jgi:hypothetical protein
MSIHRWGMPPDIRFDEDHSGCLDLQEMRNLLTHLNDGIPVKLEEALWVSEGGLLPPPRVASDHHHHRWLDDDDA